MKVQNMKSGRSGRDIPNQFIIMDDNGDIWFQSYQTMIAVKRFGKIALDLDSWDYSRTTAKYRNVFLGESKAETERKIKNGTYTLENLN